MVAKSFTVAFEGVEARIVEVQCAITAGMPHFGLVGLPDKAVSEARERVRAALGAMSIALPSKRITVNLSPADLPKEGSHFDLPIALALLAALEIIPKDEVENVIALGELSLDGRLMPVVGALPAAMAAAVEDKTLLCPRACGAEAAWVGAAEVLAAGSLDEVVRHYTGQSPLMPAEAGEVIQEQGHRDLAEVKGQERAKRALEIAAAGRHHIFILWSSRPLTFQRLRVQFAAKSADTVVNLNQKQRGPFRHYQRPILRLRRGPLRPLRLRRRAQIDR